MKRFWVKTQIPEDISKCWQWTAAKDRKGYGLFQLGTREKSMVRSAHRIAWKLTYGELPEGLCVLHKCDHPSCVNPAHLFLGTIRDNNADCKSKQRNNTGSRNGMAKLNGSQIAEIRASYRRGRTGYRKLAKAFGVDFSTIYKIVKNRRWVS
jgi:hypothetical protein